MCDLSVFFYFFKVKIVFKSHKIISDQRVLQKNSVDTHGTPFFEADYSTTGLAAPNSQ